MIAILHIFLDRLLHGSGLNRSKEKELFQNLVGPGRLESSGV